MDQSFELQTEGAQVAAAQDVEGHADIETTSGESGVANSAQGPPPSTEVPSTGLAAHGGHPESLVNAADHRDATAEGFELSPPMTHNRRIPIQLKPRIKISVSANQEHHLRAALSLSAHLDEFRIPHAYIGGFAWALLGSSRPTQDIDVLIECTGSDLEGLREKLKQRDFRFADVMLKLYFVTQECDEGSPPGDSEELVLRSRNNVLVETLPTGTMGLPATITSTYHVTDVGVRLLHPSILILTKLKRWSTSYTSTWQKTVRKVASDNNDIRYMIRWLSNNNEHIRFDDYEGKTKPELLVMLRRYYDKYADNTELMEMLQSIMPDSWDEMLALPQPEEESNLPPPSP